MCLRPENRKRFLFLEILLLPLLIIIIIFFFFFLSRRPRLREVALALLNICQVDASRRGFLGLVNLHALQESVEQGPSHYRKADRRRGAQVEPES